MIHVEELTINEANRYFDEGILSSFELTMIYLERIAKYNRTGSKLNAVLELNPDALHIAEAMDYERKYERMKRMKITFANEMVRYSVIDIDTYNNNSRRNVRLN